MDAPPLQPAEVDGPVTPMDVERSVPAGPLLQREPDALPESLVLELWREAECERAGLAVAEFADVLRGVGEKYNFGAVAGHTADARQRAAFCRGLQLRDLALARGCAAGCDAAWERFVREYGERLRVAATAITRSASMGEELAGSLYGELYGLAEREGVRRSPLASYSGRGSLMGWLRTTLAQRHVDQHRRTRREEPLEEREFAAAVETQAPQEGALVRLGAAVTMSLRGLGVEERFLVAAYFLDGRTLLELARLLRVHEATVSRRIKRLTEGLHKQILKRLEAGGMSRRAAQEVLGADPRDLRDLATHMRNVLQRLPGSTFSDRRGAEGAEGERKAKQ